MICPMCKTKNSFKVEDYQKRASYRGGSTKATLVCKVCGHKEKA